MITAGRPVAIKIRMPLALAAAMASMVVGGIAWVLKPLNCGGNL